MAVKFACKRTRDEFMNLSPPCSPHKVAFLEGPPVKRQRCDMDTESASGVKRSRENPFPHRDWNEELREVPEIARQVKRRRSAALPEHARKDKKFTLEEVREIVARVMAEKEAELMDQYNEILSARLHEQYQSFARYNEDCISRLAKSYDYSASYMS